MSSWTVSSAFEKELCRLCLQDFPCGQGSWSRPRGQGCEDDGWGYREKNGGRGPRAEEREDLIELLTDPLSPWRQEAESWSPQAAALRELSVTSQARLSGSFIRGYFTTLRIVDKGVSVIDDGVLGFARLRELVLTANCISQLPSAHLPGSLRVLEVCANQVNSLRSLCQPPPPPLQHLGLSFNRLGSASDARLLTASFWPQLVSLDLSWCGFEEQLVLVDSLSTLPRLRTLALEGNPLTLAPSYPGFLLDSLPRLLYLDGHRVTPDDRHRFHGLARRRGAVTDEAVVTVTVHRMRGVPDPSLAADSSAAEFPVVACSYLATYEFLGPLPAENQVGSESVTSSGLAVRFAPDEGLGPSRGPEGRDETPQEARWNRGEEVCHTVPHPGPPAGTGDSGLSESCSCPVMEISTPKLPWAEPIEYDHTRVYRVRDLAPLKRFFLRGLRITVEEEKVLSWPAPPEENVGTKPVTDKRGTAKESVRPPSNPCSNQKAKDKKRKKEPQVDLVQDPPGRRTLGSARVELQDLVSGGNQVYRLCDFGVPTELSARTPQEKEPSKKVKEDKKKEDKRAKPAGESIATQRTTPSKGKNKGKKDSEAEGPAETFQHLPEHLILEISVHLDKWETDRPTSCQDPAPLRR
ncbi:leucine-rich repeat-containing protein 43-like isoform X2 [Anguilla anguilla]|uniref:leucine-rich repeat-containing protein 43-like isoform X2 n=1 Tax=Anguilla anguilla TaxID=7936 RepID=UPI0015B1CB6B|nr:leucine-rich repeat-containing protein 43-like isoform X2 [Anguilla anguilla]